MQVTHQNEHVTHAVIGGKQAIDFGISSSAEFFNILSSTLYKDQILAVVREVLCNAWDAHIEASCTDTPVEVTLTSDTFIIKDFGKGIHHDDMGPIYGTYGNSTKKNDGNQTGGFGLGCKAPFAYIDHFEVISCHAGVKTIYNLSKSSAQAQGKPGIIPIASFPTEDTGLQVSIRVKSPTDHRRFHSLINRIAKNGDMNMTLNAKPINKLGFDSSKGNYFLTTGGDLMDSSTAIMVRYGNVLYPIDDSAITGSQYQRITQHLKLLGEHPRYQLIFQAPAHSISVTPSRESLSMQEHTVNTLTKLFDGFLAMLDSEFTQGCIQHAAEVTKKAVAEVKLDALLSRKKCLPSPKGMLHTVGTITDMDSMVKHYMSINYPSALSFHKQDIKLRLTLLAQSKLLDRGCVQTFLRDVDKVQSVYKERAYFQEANNWLQRKVVAPLVTKLANAGLDHTRLYVCDPEDSTLPVRYNQPTLLVPATKAIPAHHFATLPYLRNIVVLSSAKAGMTERAFRHEVFKKLGASYGFLFYHTGIKVAEKAAAVKFFNATGMQVVDLTVRQDWEPPQVKSTPVARKPKKKGMVALSSLIYRDGINTGNFYNEDAARIEQPEFVIKLSFKQYDASYCFNHLDGKASFCITKLFGSVGGVVSTTAARDACIGKGAKDFKDYVVEKVCSYMQTNPRIQEYCAFRPSRVAIKTPGVDISNQLLQLLYSNPVLMKKFSLVNNLTDEDSMYIYLWRLMVNKGSYWGCPVEIEATSNHLKAIQLSKASITLAEKLTGNVMVDLINVSKLNQLIEDKNTSQPVLDKAISFLINAING